MWKIYWNKKNLLVSRATVAAVEELFFLFPFFTLPLLLLLF